ncbi:MAG: ATP-binding cassette domain-containing protein [Clostridiales bacterium]|nr:ATP-binding cassette domain-containing protein [Clostridiales bacterium]
MLKLVNVSKDYTAGDMVTHALVDINLEFRTNEFVSVLGPSGCGKTTMLNVIGGLDKYQKGDLLLDDKSTKDFRDSEWDSYRNATIGFVFQNYNLIAHLSVLDNVEIAMTLSGVSSAERKKRAKKALRDVGLEDQIKKRPNQLSGGQMQRVAIARALVNQPKILLADEPTGAIDSHTSVTILNLLKKISKDRLVIMVTHNTNLAEKYSDRIIKLLDGRVVEDSKTYENNDEVIFTEKLKNKKVSMSFITALKSSFKNLISKKARTLITAIAGSIGIIGIALVLAISFGMNQYVNSMQSDTLAGFPLAINPTVSATSNMMAGPPGRMNDATGTDVDSNEFPTDGIIHPYDSSTDVTAHSNIISEEYLSYIDSLDKNLYNSISYTRAVALNLVIKTESGGFIKAGAGASSSPMQMFSSNGYFNEIPNSREFIESQYDLLGSQSRYPETYNEAVLIVDSENNIDVEFLEEFGIAVSDEFVLEDFIGIEFKVISNDDYYTNINNVFIAGSDYESMYNSENSLTIKITGVMRVKESASSEILSTGIGYTTMLTDKVLLNAKTSEIVVAQDQNTETNLLTGQPFTEFSTYESIIQLIGGEDVPTGMQIYPVSFDAKDEIKGYLDTYNSGKDDVEKVLYTDLAEMISGTISTLLNTITIILTAFAAISLLVSSIMIGIITYVSVVERTKEIGILRSIGARKKDISRVFIAESIIIGFVAGVIGIALTAVSLIPINIIIENLIDVSNFSSLPILQGLGLLALSIGLTFIAGFIPSRIAAKKDPVVALRTE